MGFVASKKIFTKKQAEKWGSFFLNLILNARNYKNGVEAYATVAEGVLSSAGLMRGPIAVTLAVSAGDRIFSRCVRFAPPCARAAHATLSPARRRSRRTSPSPESIFLSRAGDAPRLGERNL